MTSLAGKVAVVTGAGAGIGRAIALTFANAGAAVACLDLKRDADAVAAQIAKAGGRSLSVTCDVGIEADTLAAAKAVAREFTTAHVLVNAAATIDPNGSVLEIAPAEWARVLTVNITGAYLMSRAVLPMMIAAGGGSVIHIASQLGRGAARRRAGSCTSKGAIIQLAKAMAIDHADQNIRVNAL